MNYTQHVSTGINSIKGNEILAMIQQTKEGTMVAIKPLCAALRIDWMNQYRKITGDVRFNYSDITMVGADGKHREMICLPAAQVPMWINSINSNKVAEEKRAALLELHKFFGHALNEIIRDRYLTKEQYEADMRDMRKQYEADMRDMREQLSSAMMTIQRLSDVALRQESELSTIRQAEDHYASAASYAMHAAKKTKVLRLVN